MTTKSKTQASTERPAEAKDLVKAYEPTAIERRALEAHRDRRRRRRPAPRMKVSVEKDCATVSPDHADVGTGNMLLMEALGTADLDFMGGLLQQLANVGTKGRKVDEQGLNFMLSIVKGIEPRDHVEAMLAAQMAATHNRTMTFARRLNHVENIAQQDSAERAFNKLART